MAAFGPTFELSQFPNAAVGIAYTASNPVTGIVPISYAVSSGALPDGLTLNPVTGVISGTPTLNGLFSFSIYAVDMYGQTLTGDMTLYVAAAVVLIITTTELPNGAVGAAYNQSILVSNGVAPFSYVIQTGVLPPGLTMSGATGIISGVPTGSGLYGFSVLIADSVGASGSVNLSIWIPSSPSIANSSLPAGYVGIPYFADVSGSGGAAPYGFIITAGSLPSGLVLATTGGISGTPTVAGSFPLTIEVYDANSVSGTAPSASSTSSFIIVIQPSGTGPGGSSGTAAVTSIDEMVLIAGNDGALYALVPGQHHDEDYGGNPIGFMQEWAGVPGQSSSLAIMQLGGASVSAKGSGLLNVKVVDDDGNITPLSTDARPMFLQPTVETKRDFIAKGAFHSERFGIGFDNGGIADAWFEVHAAILWVRQFFTSRKA